MIFLSRWNNLVVMEMFFLTFGFKVKIDENDGEFHLISSSCPSSLHVFQRVDRPLRESSVGLRPHPGEVKAGEELTAKLLRLDDLVRMENDVMEPKKKRSFPGNNAPLDRLSVSSMETKHGTNKQR